MAIIGDDNGTKKEQQSETLDPIAHQRLLRKAGYKILPCTKKLDGNKEKANKN